MKLEDKAVLISQYIQEWLTLNYRIEAKPEDVMPYLKEKGIYSINRISASQFRKDLRKLYERNELCLISGLRYEQKKKNKYWFFDRVDNHYSRHW